MFCLVHWSKHMLDDGLEIMSPYYKSSAYVHLPFVPFAWTLKGKMYTLTCVHRGSQDNATNIQGYATI